MLQDKNKIRVSYTRVFFICFFSMLIILMPDIVENHGLFLYMGDYSYQQMPFYFHAADAVHNLGIGWDWYTDLGSDFIASYSFYLLGSIFFWSLSWLDGKAIIYMLPVMTAVKTAIGAAGAMAYIKRYVKNDTAAFIGAYMYAFSGFQMVNLVYNHFHDVTAIFPFLLLSFELLVTENKRCFFALITGVMALTNYFFFTGTVVFVIIYYVVKCLTKQYNFSLKNFATITFESLLGTLMSSVIMLPTAMHLRGADRVGNILCGTDWISYNDNTILPKILQSLFLLPDPPSSAMLFLSEKNQNNWASISLFLPFFAVTGVAVYLKNNSKSWISIFLFVCAVIAAVPGLNSIFSLFNESYYARWYYMPVLIMSTATSIAIDRNYDLKFGLKLQTAGLGVLALIFILPAKVVKESDELAVLLSSSQNIDKEIRAFSISSIPSVFWQSMVFSVVSLILVLAYNLQREKDKNILKKISAMMVTLVIISFCVYIDNTNKITDYDENIYRKSSFEFSPVLEGDNDFRITHVNVYDSVNAGMYWKYMNAGIFHSIEANESDNFYYAVQGEKRLMQSQYTDKDYPVYGLLSVKYIFNPSTNDDLNVERFPVQLKGCSLYDKQGPYYIYKNDNFIPMGFMYDYCIDDSTMEKYLDENVSEEDRYQYKKLIMMRALVLDEEDKEKYKDYISDIPVEMLSGLDENTYAEDCAERSLQSCSDFEYDSKGYRADISADSAGLVYFSVPCSDGWKATVNGKRVELIKVHYGLTAVPVDCGDNHIEFSYETPGLKLGITITFISLSLLIVYFVIVLIIRKNSLTEK